MISNFELDKASKIMGLKNYKGTFSKDELPNPMRPGKYIINMQDSKSPSGKSLPGTHWFYADVGANRTTVIDAFGAVPPLEILERAPCPIDWNTKQVEDLNSDLCGFFCLYFAFQHDRGRSYSSILDDFETYPRTAMNRILLDKWFEIKSK